MRLGILLGALSLASLIVGCGHKDGAGRPSDAGTLYVPRDQFPRDASNPGLVGGLYLLTPDVLATLLNNACVGPIVDGGGLWTMAADGGTCTVPILLAPDSSGRMPDTSQIIVVWTLDTSR